MHVTYIYILKGNNVNCSWNICIIIIILGKIRFSIMQYIRIYIQCDEVWELNGGCIIVSSEFKGHAQSV